MNDRQAALVDRLSQAREIRIEAEGTDVRLRVEGRTWINSNGKRNMPSGEVFTGPLEDSATGTIRFTIPSSPRGVLVEGVELTFEEGKVVRAAADRGQDYLDAALATDDGARFLGELGIGTNAGSTGPPGRPCSTRRWPAPCTSRWAPRIRRPAGATRRRCTGT